MTAEERNGVVFVESVKDFDLDNIFDCGQCFRWEKTETGMYLGTAYGRQAAMSYDKDKELLKIYGSSLEEFEGIWRHYLDLDRDYSSIKHILADKDPVMAKAIEYGQGIRILNQEKWETLISFIISQNNNIPRIKKCIDSLAATLGKKIGEFDGREFFALPDAETLAGAGLDDLAPCRLGYRAKYLIETARQVAEEGLDSLEKLGDDNVWVRKVMNRLYGIAENNMQEMELFAAKNFGRYGGIAQQYLFYYITHNKEIADEDSNIF